MNYRYAATNIYSAEPWGPKTFGKIWQFSAVFLLQIFRVNQYMQVLGIIISVDQKFLLGEFVNHFVSHVPNTSEEPGDIGGVEAEEASAVVLTHAFYNGLQVFCRHLGDAHVFHIEDASPILNLPWNHSVLNCIVSEIVDRFH